MGVSFKVSRTGTRYRRSFPPLADDDPRPDADEGRGSVGGDDGDIDTVGSKMDVAEGCLVVARDGFGGRSVTSARGGGDLGSRDHEVSFSLYLFPDGYSIGRPSEGIHSLLLQEPSHLLPYDKASKALFNAIENGWLPGDSLDDIPCQYLNGIILCQVLDFRSCLAILGNDDSSGDEFPKFQEVSLRLSMENVVKDMPSLSDDSWTYSDLLKAEAQITKALQPVLHLDPKPSFDRLCGRKVSKKLDLGIYYGRPGRKKQDALGNLKPADLPDGVEITSAANFPDSRDKRHDIPGDGRNSCVRNGSSHGIPNVQPNAISKDVSKHALSISSQKKFDSIAINSEPLPETGVINPNFISAPNPDPRVSCDGPRTSINCTLGKKDRQKCEASPKPMTKRLKEEPSRLVSRQPIALQNPTLPVYNVQSKRSLLKQQQQHLESDRVQQPRFNEQKIPRPAMSEQIVDIIPKLDSVAKRRIKEEPVEIEYLNRPEVEENQKDHAVNLGTEKSNVHQSSTLAASHLPPCMEGSNDNTSTEKCPRKEGSSRKRKSAQGTRASACHSTHSPAPSKARRLYGDLSVGSGPGLQKGIGGSTIHHCTDSLPRTSGMVTVAGSKPILSCNTSIPTEEAVCPSWNINIVNPTVDPASSMARKPCLLPSEIKGDLSLLERFSKIEMVTQRFGLDCRTQKNAEIFEKKSSSHCPQLPFNLLNSEDIDGSENFMDEMPMSNYLLGLANNVYKTRILTFAHAKISSDRKNIPDRVCKSLNMLILYELEEPSDHIGVQIAFEEGKPPVHLPILQNWHHADIFTSQFTSLMKRDGYELVGDQIQPLTANTAISLKSSSIIARLQQSPYTVVISGESMTNITPLSFTGSSSVVQQSPCQNMLSPCRDFPSLYNLSRPQQLDIAACHNSLQQQHSQTPQSLLHVENNILGAKTLQMDNQVVSTHANIPCFQLLQQNKHHQSCRNIHAIMQRRLTEPEVMRDVINTGDYVSGLSNVGQIYGELGQTSSLYNLNQQLLCSGKSQAHVTAVDNLRQTNFHAMRMMDTVPMRTLNDFLKVNGFLLDHGRSQSGTNKLQCVGRLPTSLPNVPPLDFGLNNYRPLKQHLLQQQMHTDWQQQLQHWQQPNESTHQLVAQLPATNSQQLSAGMAARQINWVNYNIGSPHVSAQTVGTVDSMTSLPTEFPGLGKGGSGSKAVDMEGIE